MFYVGLEAFFEWKVKKGAYSISIENAMRI